MRTYVKCYIIYPLFIASHNSMNDFLLYLTSSISQVVFWFSCCLSFSCETHFPIFWIFPMDFKRMETASRVTFNAYNSSSNFIDGFPHSSFLTSKSPLLNFLNHSKHCDLPRACSSQASTSIRCDSAAVFFKW